MTTRLIALMALGLLSLPAWAQEPVWIADPRTGCRTLVFSSDPAVSFLWTGGGCKDGLVEGQGMMLYFYKDQPAGNYRGGMKAGRRHGRGLFTTKSGATYDGDWVDGARQGFGTYRWVDGATYVGEWNNNIASGIGTFTDKRGNVSTGTWLGGCLHTSNPRSARPGIAIGSDSKTCR